MKLRREHVWPFLIALTVFVVSGQSEVATPPTFGMRVDLVAHFVVFGALATMVVRIPEVRERGWRGAVFAVGVVSLYGALDEFRQSFTPGRSVEFADWVADTVGALVAVVAYTCWGGYRRGLEWSFTHRGRGCSPPRDRECRR